MAELFPSLNIIHLDLYPVPGGGGFVSQEEEEDALIGDTRRVALHPGAHTPFIISMVGKSNQTMNMKRPRGQNEIEVYIFLCCMSLGWWRDLRKAFKCLNFSDLVQNGLPERSPACKWKFFLLVTHCFSFLTNSELEMYVLDSYTYMSNLISHFQG